MSHTVSAEIRLHRLGSRNLAAYARSGDQVRFYEIDPQVIAYSFGAKPYFTFVRDSPAKISVVSGDARLSLDRSLEKPALRNLTSLSVDDLQQRFDSSPFAHSGSDGDLFAAPERPAICPSVPYFQSDA